MAGDEFVFDWTKKLGFKRNPFSKIVPKKIDKYFAGLSEERKKLNLFVLERYPFGTIKGPEGYGKTTLLKWIESQLGQHKSKVRIAYINASELEKERDLIQGLAEPLLNFWEKNVGKKAEKLRLEELGKFIYKRLESGQRLLILLDDVGGLPKRYVSLFKYFFQNKIGVQLIVAGTKKEVSSSGIEDVAEKDWLEIELEGYSFEDMKSLLEKRIKNMGQEGIFPFREGMVEDLYEESDGNPSKFLELCREKAVKLALDKDYIKEELDKVAELKGEVEEATGGIISINLGGSKEKKKEDDDLLFDLMEAPDEEEQKEMLHEFEDEEDKEIIKEEKEEIEEDIEEAVKEAEDEKDREQADKTEELLSQLTEEFNK